MTCCYNWAWLQKKTIMYDSVLQLKVCWQEEVFKWKGWFGWILKRRYPVKEEEKGIELEKKQEATVVGKGQKSSF